MKMRVILGGVVAVGLISQAAWAVPIQWSSTVGGNDHWYDVVLGDLTWHQAQANAVVAGGYLATLTSEAEELFVYTNLAIGTTMAYWELDSAGNYQGPWLGGYQLSGASQLDSDWVWVTGEMRRSIAPLHLSKLPFCGWVVNFSDLALTPSRFGVLNRMHEAIRCFCLRSK